MRSIGNFIPALIMALILTACAVGGVRMSDEDHAKFMAIDDHLIVPGVRIGPVFLGMTEADLYKKLGDPTSTDYHNENHTMYNYPLRGLSVLVSMSTRVVDGIGTSSGAYSTAGGLRVGSSPLQMKAELGNIQGVADYLHHMNYDGISISFDQYGNVASFYVTFFFATDQGVYW